MLNNKLQKKKPGPNGTPIHHTLLYAKIFYKTILPTMNYMVNTENRGFKLRRFMNDSSQIQDIATSRSKRYLN